MTLALTWTQEALADLTDIWHLVAHKSGTDRADGLTAKIEAFCHRLTSIPKIGTRHDEYFIGLRSVGVAGIKRASVLFRETPNTLLVLRVGYLGRNIWEDIPQTSAVMIDE